MRICSFFSSATELLYALGAGDEVVGRSERCDYPLQARRKPIVVRSRIRSARLSSRGIHEAVETLRRRGEHQYEINVSLLKRLRPELVITQELCNVCAASHPEVTEAVRQLPTPAKTVSVTAGRFAELFDAIDVLGRAIGRNRQAKTLNRRLHRDIAAIRRRIRQGARRPRVWCAEWLDPLMAAGHWIPEMVAMAGGADGLGRPGRDSLPLPWEPIRRYDPDVILVMPCSFSIARTVREFPLLTRLPGWRRVSAVKTGRVFAVRTSLFHRPGPRLVQGVELLAALLHPEAFPRPSPADARALR